MRLLLIRHGQTPSNVAGLLDTRIPGAELSELGHEQAAAIPGVLTGIRIDAIFATTQVRSQLTAAPLAAERGLPITVRDGLREISAGDFEMRNDQAAVEAYMTAVLTWATGDLSPRIAGGEDGHEAFGRFDAVISEISELGLDTVAVVSHGAMLRAWTGHTALNVDGEFAAANPLTNTAMIMLDGSATEGWTVLTWSGESISGETLTDLDSDGPAAD